MRQHRQWTRLRSPLAIPSLCLVLLACGPPSNTPDATPPTNDIQRELSSLTTPSDLAGEYGGYLRIEGSQYDASVTLSERADERDPTMSGVLRVPGLGIDASISGEVANGVLSLDLPFTSGTLGCSGQLRGDLVAPGLAGRLAGDIRISGECSGDDLDTGLLLIDRITPELR